MLDLEIISLMLFGVEFIFYIILFHCDYQLCNDYKFGHIQLSCHGMCQILQWLLFYFCIESNAKFLPILTCDGKIF